MCVEMKNRSEITNLFTLIIVVYILTAGKLDRTNLTEQT